MITNISEKAGNRLFIMILCAIEMHTRTTASETMEVVEKLKEIYDIDETRIYATGFSMGGIKTWDLYQEQPESFATLAPMGATVDVGKNTQFSDAPSVNEDVPVLLFYNGGENSPLGELYFQNYICVNRIEYLFKVNQVEMPFDATYGFRGEWDDPVYIYAGDQMEELCDENYPESKTTIRYYRSEDGNIYIALCSISNHQHEVRPFTCRQAWDFMKWFSRVDGKIVISKEYEKAVPDRVPLLSIIYCLSASNACSKSAIRSLTSSQPQEILIRLL